jgi:hypothetical protein
MHVSPIDFVAIRTQELPGGTGNLAQYAQYLTNVTIGALTN